MDKETDRVIVVDGEAPESSSDEEIESFDLPITMAKEVCESPGTSLTTSQSLGNEFSSVFHRKLYEKNEDLWSHICGLLSRSITSSSKNLIATDQLLLKCQITLQAVHTSTKKVNNATRDIVANFGDLLNSNFLPPIINPARVQGTFTSGVGV